MTILIPKELRLIVQGITGNEGLFHTRQMIHYNTNIVAGVSPGKGGDWVMDGKIPVFDTVKNAVEVTGANASVIFVPAKYTADAIFEAVDAALDLVVCITEGVPVMDMMRVKEFLRTKKTRLVGPNCPGIIAPGNCKVGIVPGNISIPGNIGIVSRSGTLTYEAADQVVKQGLGITTAIGIGGDPIIGTTTKEAVELLMNDKETELIVMIGEIGGQLEADAARWIRADGNKKPVVGFIAGQTAPAGRTMGHAGAIVGGKDDTAQAKMAILRENGIHVVESPAEIGKKVAELLK